jgi:hypothetical protein
MLSLPRFKSYGYSIACLHPQRALRPHSKNLQCTVHAPIRRPTLSPTIYICDTYHGSFEHSEELDGKAVRGGAKKLGAWLNLGDMPQNEDCEGKGLEGRETRGRGRKAEKTGLRSKALYMRTGMVDLGDDALRPHDTTRARREQRAHKGPPESEAISQIATRCQRAVTGPRAYTLTSGQSLFRSSSRSRGTIIGSGALKSAHLSAGQRRRLTGIFVTYIHTSLPIRYNNQPPNSPQRTTDSVPQSCSPLACIAPRPPLFVSDVGRHLSPNSQSLAIGAVHPFADSIGGSLPPRPSFIC